MAEQYNWQYSSKKFIRCQYFVFDLSRLSRMYIEDKIICFKFIDQASNYIEFSSEREAKKTFDELFKLMGE